MLVAGAGALGSVCGGFLRRAGHDVTLLGRGAHVATVAARGLHIDGLWGEHHVTGLVCTTDPAALAGSFDAILITVKSYDTAAMVRAVAPRLAADGVMISLQNGLGNVEHLIAVAGAHRAVAGRVIFGAVSIAPGHVRVTVYAEPVLLGAWRSGAEPALDAQVRRWVEHFAAAGIPTQCCDDIRGALWGKVLYNAALNPLGALLGVHYGALGEDANTRALMDAVIDETCAVAAAERVHLAWPSAAAYREVFYGRLLPATFDHRSSMLQDLERGRRTEVDAINGHVWRLGHAHGIVTPINEVLTRLVHAREALTGASR